MIPQAFVEIKFGKIFNSIPKDFWYTCVTDRRSEVRKFGTLQIELGALWEGDGSHPP